MSTATTDEAPAPGPITHVFVPPFRGPLDARIVLADPASGDDVFITATARIGPGESVQFTYPDRGFDLTADKAST